MYAIGHTTHRLISISAEFISKIIARKSKSKINFKRAFYCTNIKNETWSFFETYEEAQAELAMLFLGGGGA